MHECEWDPARYGSDIRMKVRSLCVDQRTCFKLWMFLFMYLRVHGDLSFCVPSVGKNKQAPFCKLVVQCARGTLWMKNNAMLNTVCDEYIWNTKLFFSNPCVPVLCFVTWTHERGKWVTPLPFLFKLKKLYQLIECFAVRTLFWIHLKRKKNKTCIKFI